MLFYAEGGAVNITVSCIKDTVSFVKMSPSSIKTVVKAIHGLCLMQTTAGVHWARRDMLSLNKQGPEKARVNLKVLAMSHVSRNGFKNQQRPYGLNAMNTSNNVQLPALGA